MKKTLRERVLDLVQIHFGEIGEPIFEDDYVWFEVYRGDYEEASETIRGAGLTLVLSGKFDDPFFSVYYKISEVPSSR